MDLAGIHACRARAGSYEPDPRDAGRIARKRHAGKRHHNNKSNEKNGPNSAGLSRISSGTLVVLCPTPFFLFEGDLWAAFCLVGVLIGFSLLIIKNATNGETPISLWRVGRL